MKRFVPVILAFIYLLTSPFWSGVADKVNAAQTATLSFANPANNGSVALDANNRFTIDININTAGQDSIGADVLVNFDSATSAKLDFVPSGSSMSNFYPIPNPPTLTNNFMERGVTLISMGGLKNFGGSNVNGSGRLATLQFGLKSGVTLPTTVTFSFYLYAANPTTDTNITGTADDIWNQQISSATITITGYVPPAQAPLITSLNPNNGAAAGGYDVVINGDSTRNFGTTAGTVRWNSNTINLKTGTSWNSTLLTVVAPPGTAGASVPITVTNAATGLTSAAVNFTYNTGGTTNPTITSLDPTHGAISGAYQVDIIGTNLDTTNGTITFGNTVMAANDTRISSPRTANRIRLTSIPAVTAGGTATVSVAGATGSLTFTYDTPGTTTPTADPYISYLTPNSGMANADVVVTIVGGNFGTTSNSVTFGQYTATVSSWTNTEIKVTAPKLGQIASSVSYEVRVTRSDGKYATSYYTYLAPASTGGTGGDDTTADTGMPMGAWAGLISANGALAFFVKRKFF